MTTETINKVSIGAEAAAQAPEVKVTMTAKEIRALLLSGKLTTNDPEQAARIKAMQDEAAAKEAAKVKTLTPEQIAKAQAREEAKAVKAVEDARKEKFAKRIEAHGSKITEAVNRLFQGADKDLVEFFKTIKLEHGESGYTLPVKAVRTSSGPGVHTSSKDIRLVKKLLKKGVENGKLKVGDQGTAAELIARAGIVKPINSVTGKAYSDAITLRAYVDTVIVTPVPTPA